MEIFPHLGREKVKAIKWLQTPWRFPLRRNGIVFNLAAFLLGKVIFFTLIPFPNEEGDISPPSVPYMMEIMGRKIRHQLRQINAKVKREPNNNWLAEEKRELELRLKNSKAMVLFSLRKK